MNNEEYNKTLAAEMGFNYKTLDDFRQALAEEIEKRFGKKTKYIAFIVMPGSEHDSAGVMSNMERDYSAGLLYKALGRALNVD